MLPELKNLITDMVPSIKLIVKKAVSEATGALNDEVWKLKDNESFQKVNSALEKRISQAEYDKMHLNNTVVVILSEFLASTERLMRTQTV